MASETFKTSSGISREESANINTLKLWLVLEDASMEGGKSNPKTLV
jgi:hypothetical protein